jgi:two-component sensor histidine kinase
MLILTVSDDGIGFPPGVNVRTASTLGLRIVNKLVEQLKGALVMGDGPGTSFTITFPAG